ncbi:hypothetical protein QZH41_009933 [Actinostola sp. cb2023]|nr:hypothetical protein QZH41_009933 [Actinostola sp. cb2023]
MHINVMIMIPLFFCSLCKKDLSCINAKVLAQLTGLEELDLSGNKLKKLETDGVCLMSLSKIDLSNNQLTSLDGFSAFPNLKDVNISNNPSIEVSEKYKLVYICPTLQILDNKDVSMMRDAASRLDSTLLCKISEVWRKGFEDRFSRDIDSEKLETEFLDKLKKEITCGPSMLKDYREFRLSILGKEHIQKLRMKFECSGSPRKKKKNEGVLTIYFSFELLSRCFNGEIKQSKELTTNSSIKDEPTDIKEQSDIKNVQETSIASARFVVSHLLQTHSLNNDPDDRRTQVWGCEFEPSVDKPGETIYSFFISFPIYQTDFSVCLKGETTSICATCGGDSVCFIDCNSGQVMKKYKQPGEIFYCIAWTTVTMDFNGNSKKTNLLAAGGQQKDIKIIEPNQLVCCEEITGLKGVLECLSFHPVHSSWLFCAANDLVTVWDIGFQRGGTEKSKQLLTLKSRTVVRSFAIPPHGNTLVGACDDGCFFWKIDEMDKNNEKSRIPFGKLSFPGKKTLPLDCVQCLSNQVIATKRVEDGTICVWYSESDMMKNDFTLLYKFPWRRTETPFLKFSFVPSYQVLIAGDDQGCVWMYKIKENIDIIAKDDIPQTFKHAQVLMCPNESTKLFNQVCANSSLEYIVAAADTNVVCMWRRISSQDDHT